MPAPVTVTSHARPGNLALSSGLAGRYPGAIQGLGYRSRRVLAGEDGGDNLRGHPVREQVDLCRPPERGRRLGKWWSGPRRSVERGHGSRMGSAARAASVCLRRGRQVSRPTTPAAPMPTITAAAMRTIWRSSEAAARTGPASLTANAAARTNAPGSTAGHLPGNRGLK